jgi:acetyl-CoA carboxylase biotin carboxyl carrier protein
MTKSSQVDQDLIRAIAELLNKENLAEIEIEQEDLRVRVTRSYPNEAPTYAAPMQYMQAPQAAPAAPSDAAVVPPAAAASAPASTGSPR